MAERLSAEARKSALKELSGWSEAAGREAIAQNLHLQGFQRGVRLHVPASRWSPKRHDHHPEWRNVYKTVEVVLATHDAGGVTALDIDLAKAMNAIARQLGVG